MGSSMQASSERRGWREGGRAVKGGAMTHLLKVGRDDLDAGAVRDGRVVSVLRLEVSLEQTLVGLRLWRIAG